jgi:hypothetical protein
MPDSNTHPPSAPSSVLPTLSEETTLPDLFQELDTLHKGEAWRTWEPETLAVSLIQAHPDFEGTLPPLLVEKLHVLMTILRHEDPNGLVSDPAFALYACDVVNGEVANFDTIPSPLSLEFAAYVVSLSRLFSLAGLSFDVRGGIREIAAETLVNDGYSSAPKPLDMAEGLRGLTPFTPSGPDVSKAQAIITYLQHLSLLS